MTSPEEARQLNDLAAQLLGIGQAAEAEQAFELLLSLGQADARSLDSLIVLRVQRGDYAGALPALAAAIERAPDNPNYHDIRAVCFLETGRHGEAADDARRAIALAPANAESHANLSVALHRLGQAEDALAAIERALELAPDSSDNLINQANVLRDLGRPEAALAAVERACLIRPTSAPAHYNRGNILQDLGRHAEAVRAYDVAVQLDSQAADPRWNRGLCNLLLGNHGPGWADYDMRWKRSVDPVVERRYAAPRWTGGEDLAGKTILLHCEQGFGDSIQFVRYAARVAALGATVVVAAQQSLVELLSTAPGVSRVVRLGEAPPPVDYHCPIMSLPRALWTHDPTIPASIPYLTVAPETRDRWRGGLGATGRRRVGLVYSGNPKHGNDHNRSLETQALLDALPEGPDYFVLQKDLRPGDADAIARRGDITNLSDAIETFADTAAICTLMDLVVSVDTSVAHLAGALGRPLWVLIPYDPDWRWGLERETSDWYPTARILRQTTRGDWRAALEALRRDLSVWALSGAAA
jgi:Flp pilus assembly protein TadD